MYCKRPIAVAMLATIAVTGTATGAAAAGGRASARFYARPGTASPFSPAVRAGNYIFLSGQIGARRDGTIPPSIAEQTALAMGSIRDALASAGASLDDVVKCTAMLDDMAGWPEFNRSYVGFFRPGHLPARSAFGTTGLALGAGIEIECIAYKPLRRAR